MRSTTPTSVVKRRQQQHKKKKADTGTGTGTGKASSDAMTALTRLLGPTMDLYNCAERKCATPAYAAAREKARPAHLPQSSRLVREYDRCGTASCGPQFVAYVKDAADRLDARAALAPAQRRVAAELRRRLTENDDNHGHGQGTRTKLDMAEVARLMATTRALNVFANDRL